MLGFLRKAAQQFLSALGWELSRKLSDPIIDQDETFLSIYRQCSPYTMTSKERMYALYEAVRYVVKAKVPGDIVECGVWKGGSMMLVALTLLELGDTDRRLYLYDTYAGMAEPTREDYRTGKDQEDSLAERTWKQKQKGAHNEWAFSPLQQVKKRMESTGYPLKRVEFIRGKVEETIPGTLPQTISILRLDTDWYLSTKHELQHLYPHLSRRGVLIIDDYGAWAGAKQAVDEFLMKEQLFLSRVDFTGRVAIKP